MPLPPLPANNTVRVWLKYTSVGIEHELMFRMPSFSSATDAQTKAQSLATVISQRMDVTDSTLSVRYSAAGSTFSVPLAHTPVPGVLSTGIRADDPESTQLSITGRSFADGRKVTWELFSGAQFGTWPADNRFNPGESAPMDTFRINFTNWLPGLVGPAAQVVTIGGSIPTVNPYVNVRQNGYWQNEQR